MNEKKNSRPSSLSSTYQGYLDTLAKSRIVTSRLLTRRAGSEGMRIPHAYRTRWKENLGLTHQSRNRPFDGAAMKSKYTP